MIYASVTIYAIILTMIYFILTILLIGITPLVFHPAFGGRSQKKDQKIIKASKHFKKGAFHNSEKTTVDLRQADEGIRKTLMNFLFENRKLRTPEKPLSNEVINPSDYQKNYPNDALVRWLGHSTVLIRMEGKTLITDPIFSDRASPFQFMGPKKFDYEIEYCAQDLPKIDAVLISHDHYDHLDYHTIKKLKNKVNYFYVPLGVKAHLLKWGVDESKIIALDWYQENQLDEIKLTLAPARHFSGRTLSDRNQTLWGGWIIQSTEKSIYFSGDTGYTAWFKKTGERYGPFDLALMECGAYNKRWATVHMMPEESIQAAMDLRAKAYLPIHNSKFNLSFHPWQEPLERALSSIESRGMNLITPVIGRPFKLNGNLPQKRWWQSLIKN